MLLALKSQRLVVGVLFCRKATEPYLTEKDLGANVPKPTVTNSKSV